jgi:hypothetical protein
MSKKKYILFQGDAFSLAERSGKRLKNKQKSAIAKIIKIQNAVIAGFNFLFKKNG